MFRVPFAAFWPRVAVFSLLIVGGLLAPLRGTAASAPPLLRVRPVAPDVFVPTLYDRAGSAASGTNGLVVRTTEGILLIDTAWNPEQTRLLLRWVADSLHQRVRLAIVTHAEAASPAGLAVLRENRIRVYSSPPTSRRWQLRHPQAAGPTAALKPYTVIRAGRTRLELFFPGPGFTTDNGVAWLPRRKVLFGGELVREQGAAGFTPPAGADLRQWPATLRTLAVRYRKARVVVPAHGAIGDLTLLTHTQTLLREAARRKPQTALNGRP